MLRKFLIGLLCACSGIMFAQSGYVTITGANIKDSSGNPVTSAKIFFTPVDANQRPISYRNGSGGQSSSTRVQATITNGAFTAQLADTSLTIPKNICYAASIVDNATGNQLLTGPGYTCIQPSSTASWCSVADGVTTCNFDNYSPPVPNLPLTQVQVVFTNGGNGSEGPQGPAGADGKSVLSGSGAPNSGLGIDGDFYIDTAAHLIYGPKTSGAWGSGVSLVGPAGSTGAQGIPGPSGASVATPLTPGTSITLTVPRGYAVCSSTCTVTVPAPAAGQEFCALNGDNVSTVITLAGLGSSASYEKPTRDGFGTAGTGTLASGGAIGDRVCIIGLDSTHYLTSTVSGTWTAN